MLIAYHKIHAKLWRDVGGYVGAVQITAFLTGPIIYVL